MDIDIETHPNPQPNPHHRKIDLQSPHDLTYLQNNLAASALQKLDLHFPILSKPATYIPLDLQPQPSEKQNQGQDATANKKKQDDEAEEEEEDPMRQRVRNLVREFLTTTWQSAGHNISVNGTDASTIPLPHTSTLSPAPVASTSAADADEATREEIEGVHFRHEPFDAALQRRLASLHAELETLTAQVSKLRRTAPTQGRDRYEARLKAVMDADEQAWEREQNEQSQVQGLEVDEVPRPGWNGDVRDMYEHGRHGLAGLAGVGVTTTGPTDGGEQVRGPTLTETVGKVQRARTVAMEME